MTETTHTKGWYIRREGELRGPFPRDIIERYVLLGRIERDDELSSDKSHWQPLHLWSELIPVELKVPEGQLSEVRRERLEVARRWAGELEPHHHHHTEAGGSRLWAYGLVIALVAAVATLPILLPKEAVHIDFQCATPAAPGVVWRDCRLDARDLSGANLRGADMQGANLSSSTFRNTNLAGSQLSYANLSASSLRSADLSGARLVGANLRGVDLRGANLGNADLSYADLTGAQVAGANFAGARLDFSVWGERTCLADSIGQCKVGQTAGAQ